VKIPKKSRITPTGDSRKNVPGTRYFLQPPTWGNFLATVEKVLKTGKIRGRPGGRPGGVISRFER
jgi:hypothetical protein